MSEEQEQVVPAGQETPAAQTQDSAPAKTEATGENREASADETGADDSEGERPKKSKIQKDFDRLTRQRGTLERENRALAERLARLEGQMDAKGSQREAPQQTADGKPRLEDFGSYDAFNEALTDWKVDQKLKAREQAHTQEQRQRQAQTQDQQRKERFMESSDAAREKYDDFDEVAFGDEVKVTKAMAVIIAESDNPGEMAYFLGKNPSEASRIAKLSPEKAALELGKLEAKMAAPPAKTQTGAPPPAKTIKGGSATGRVTNTNSPDAIYAKFSH